MEKSVLDRISEPNVTVMEVKIESGDWPDLKVLKQLSEQCLMESIQVANPNLHPGSELSLTFCDEERMRELNRQWRSVDSSTNVLSFPIANSGSDPLGPLLGDILVGFELVEQEAKREGKVFEHHLAHLIVHGILHLFGYDHNEAEDAEIMEQLERRILGNLSISDPYGNRCRGTIFDGERT